MKRPQAFLIMGFIVAISLAVGFYAQIQVEKDARVRLEKTLTAVAKERDVLEKTMTARLQERERFISYLSASLSKEKSIHSKLAANLERSARRFQIASQPKKAVELEKIIVSSLLEAEGKVLAVDKQNDLFVINLGAINNLKNGDRLSIYRGDNFITTAELVKVHDRISAAMASPADNAAGLQVEVDDTVK